MLLSTVIAQGVFLILLRKKPQHPEPEDNKDEVRKFRETNDESEGTQ